MVLGGGCSCGGDGGGRVIVVVLVVVVMVVFPPVTAQAQTVNQGRFQLHASCGSVDRLRNLVVNDPMWLRTGDEEATLFTSTSNKTCLLQPHTTHLVTAHISVEIHVGGATGMEDGKEGTEEGKKMLCFFPKQDVELDKGLLKVSCLKERDEAEAEMLGAQESPGGPTTKDFLATTLVISTTSPASSATSPTGSVTPPASNATPPANNARPSARRSFGLPSPRDATQPTSTTAGPQDTHESLVKQPAPESPTNTGMATSSLGTPEKTTTTVTETTTASTTHPPVTDDAVMMTTPGKEATETSAGLVTEDEATTHTLSDGTTLTTPGGSGTEEAEHTGMPKESDKKKENISAAEPVMLSNAPQTDGDGTGMPDDQMVYLAGAGAGVLALVLGVVVVASVAHHRRRQARAAARQGDLFMGGGYKGSMNSLTRSGSGRGTESGAYLNAHVMYYSGADVEVVESIELEERILSSSGISYSSHDIPKCLK